MDFDLSGQKLLILGASFDQLAMINSAKAMGCQVYVCDRNPNAPGNRIADKALPIDTSDISKLIEISKKYRINGVATMATNLAPLSVVKICEHLGLPSINYSAVINSTDKDKMRSICSLSEIPIAEGGTALNLNDAYKIAQEVGFPLLFKPSDSSGCRGIQIVRKYEDILKCYTSSTNESTKRKIVIERYHENALVFGVESIICRGKTYLIIISEKIVKSKPIISTAGVTSPPNIPNEIIRLITVLVDKIHKAFNLTMGASHIDFILDNGTPRIIDIGPRLAGGPLIFELALKIKGVDMVKHIVCQSLGLLEEPIVENNSLVGIERFMYSPVSGILEDYSFPDIHPGMLFQWRKSKGEYIMSTASNTDRLGFITFIGNNILDAETKVFKWIKKSTLYIRTDKQNIIETPPTILFNNYPTSCGSQS